MWLDIKCSFRRKAVQVLQKNIKKTMMTWIIIAYRAQHTMQLQEMLRSYWKRTFNKKNFPQVVECLRKAHLGISCIWYISLSAPVIRLLTKTRLERLIYRLCAFEWSWLARSYYHTHAGYRRYLSKQIYLKAICSNVSLFYLYLHHVHLLRLWLQHVRYWSEGRQ